MTASAPSSAPAALTTRNGRAASADAALAVDLGADGAAIRPYAAARVAGALGFPGDDPIPPDALFAIGTAGATAHVVPGLDFVAEGGAGGVFPRGVDAGVVTDLGVALVGRISSSH